MSKKIIIITGDPNSINSEIIYKCWKKLNKNVKKRIYFISNYKLIKEQFKKLGFKIKIFKLNDLNEKNNSNKFKIIDLKLNFKNPFKVKKTNASNFVINSLNLAHTIATRSKDVIGIINCPLNKNLLPNKKFGVTEYLASKCNIKKGFESMLIRNKKLSVSPISTHVDIKEVSKKLKTAIIVNKAKSIDTWFKKNFKRKPKIAILGLNPHNAEFRKNSEEKRVIIPAILKIKKLKINVKGPFVADTIFIKDYKNFDIIIGMYHDQVLAPFKSLFKFDAINITVGLKYLRVSPDHGVAANLIGKNKANPTSLYECIHFVSKYNRG
jgi:4-hydroxythreonine-4-phosphate dehydrogenase